MKGCQRVPEPFPAGATAQIQKPPEQKLAGLKLSPNQVFALVKQVVKGITDEKARGAAYKSALEALAKTAGVDKAKYKTEGEFIRAVLKEVVADQKKFGPNTRKKAGEALKTLEEQKKLAPKGACGKLFEKTIITPAQAIKALNAVEKAAKDTKMQETREYKEARQTVIDYAEIGWLTQLFAFKETELRTALKVIVADKENKFDKKAVAEAKQAIEKIEKEEKEAVKPKEAKPGKK